LVPILWWATETAIDPDDKLEFVVVGIMTIVQFSIGAGAKFFRQDWPGYTRLLGCACALFVGETLSAGVKFVVAVLVVLISSYLLMEPITADDRESQRVA
jgi:hypothetical protein